MDNKVTQLLDTIQQYKIKCDISRIDRAIAVCMKAHASQLRKSGEPYYNHPIEVARMLTEMELDEATIIAGLLHDVAEDTDYDIDNITTEFGSEVGELVNGVTKLKKIHFSSKEEEQAENMRKMFLSMAKDIRVIVIKLCDRLHNMRTLEYQNKERQIYKATETLQIYAPLAHRLGMIKIKWELEDLCFRYLEPEEYKKLAEQIAAKRAERDVFIADIIQIIDENTKKMDIKTQIDGRPKHLYSIHKKMVRQDKMIDQIFDLYAIRIIVGTVKDCYAVLGIVHELFKPMPGRFKDYIAMPKPNMYQSLHNTLIGPKGIPFEVQIRTWDMHKISETGIASHWNYKEDGKTDSKFDSKIAWIRRLMEEQKEMESSGEFMESFKLDLFTDEVFVFTPKGDVSNLPAGSTPVDFAYSIHSAIGNRIMGAKINGEIKPLDYKLKNGDIVEIITSSAINGPSRDWLKFIRTSNAKNKINHWFKKEMREENIKRGKEMLEQQLKKYGMVWKDIFKPEWVKPILNKYNFSNIDDMYSAVGFGGVSTNKIITRLREQYKKEIKPDDLNYNIAFAKEFVAEKVKKNKTPQEGIIVKGIENCLVRLSRCCNPVPGDSIVGYITRGRGVSVHRSDCVNVVSGIDSQEKERLIEVSWANAKKTTYPADFIISAYDRSSLILEVMNQITDMNLTVRAMNARLNKEGIAIINITLDIQDTEQLDRIINRIDNLQGVIKVNRIKN